jgi:hypothetical protein
MASRFSSALLGALALLGLIACGSPPPRFPQGRAVMWKDDDTRPFVTPCKPDPEEPGHQLCAPEPYVSPFAWDAADNTVFLPLSRALSVPPSLEAVNVNALDEVPDSSWFENRLGRHGMTLDEIALGPCSGGKVLDENEHESIWLIDQGKPNGANPGFRVRTDAGKFMLKSDIQSEPERATAAAAIATRIYWAFGFFSPCDSVVYFDPSRLTLKPGLKVTDNSGVAKSFDSAALAKLLGNAARRGERVRMSSSRWLSGRAIGPFTYSGVREDDPNDVIAHEHRRELRASRLVGAWLNHFDSREQNSMNVWMPVNAADPDSTPGHIRHYLLDFGDCFGSQWDWDGISRRLGHANYLDFPYLAEDFITFGTQRRPWDTARITPGAEIFSYFSARDFVPEAWRGGYPNPAFAEMTERDGAWAARIIARFSREHLRRIVAAGNLTKSLHSTFLLETLIGRQEAILRRYFRELSPLADVEVMGSKLCATDLARSSSAFLGHRFEYRARRFVGESMKEEEPLSVTPGKKLGRVCVDLPRLDAGNEPPGSPDRYTVIDITNGQAKGPLRVHLYDLGAKGIEFAGLERPEDDDPPEF